jgi:ribosomal protein L37AE/L43A
MLTPEQITTDLIGTPESHPFRHLMVEVVRKVVDEVRKDDEALIRQMLDHIERNTCTHEETHRGGVIWEICDGCGAKWADDEGGKPPFAWPKVVLAAHARLEEPPCAPKP